MRAPVAQGAFAVQHLHDLGEELRVAYAARTDLQVAVVRARFEPRAHVDQVCDHPLSARLVEHGIRAQVAPPFGDLIVSGDHAAPDEREVLPRLGVALVVALDCSHGRQ